MGSGSSKMSKDEFNKLKDETHFEKREIHQWYKGFMKDCPTGSMSKEDFQNIYRQFFPFGDSSAFSEFVFNVFDKDNNGLIDFKEFIKALSITSRGTLEDKLIWSFELYDIDGNGRISYQEMLSIVTAIYKMVGTMVKLPEDESTPEKRVDKVFSRMNKTKDDELTLEEFRIGSKADPTIVSALNLYDGLV
ncbi:EF-hand protein [Nadsonia fulvescens var. elongata DSM 6958]|uniref:Calcium-binding protein NCS-1 n=1 Tax=Nadsonia fulvescens var. elongata DSM 6958 TaxID=857566 RepID=A0A1E3PMD7_9ASCO|nr:EF-hand protein [Nadsonia fulvescens var. elongata DSM 6958]